MIGYALVVCAGLGLFWVAPQASFAAPPAPDDDTLSSFAPRKATRAGG
jgi:hypothetical protein